jgi:2-keto-4-pentenoate hydratase
VPSASLADLIAIARERGFNLPKGSIISTGSASVPFDITAPATITAKYLDRTLSFSITSP